MHTQISSLLRRKFLIKSRRGLFSISRLFCTEFPPNFQMSLSEKEMNRILQKANANSRKAMAAHYPPSHVTLQVIGNGALGAPKSVFLSSNHTNFLFNCGEGTQRLANEYHMRLTKLEHVLFTTATWQNMGGLPGMALTIQECGVSELSLHGPEGIVDIFEAVKKFVNLTELTVTEAICNEDKIYQDNCLTIRYVHLKNSTTESDSDSEDPLDVDDTNYYASESWNQHRSKSPNRTNVPALPHRKISGCLAYVCKITDKPGALDLEACLDRGVKPGPMLGQLKSGLDVTLEDGTVIKGSDVCEPPSIGPTFVVLECPDEDYLDSLLSHSSFRDCQMQSGNPATVVVHFTPDRIMKHPRYVEWMKRFPASTMHMVVNEANGGLIHESCCHLQKQLNLVHPTIFPHLCSWPVPENTEDDGLKIIHAKTLNSIHLRPLDGFSDTTVVPTSMDDFLAELRDKNGFEQTLAELKKEIKSREELIESSDKFPKIVMLGTGSSVPNKNRNTSCIVLRPDEKTNIIMDCGEGTYGQICRFFGPESHEFLRNIKAVYLSHLHADHHLGLLGLLQARRKLTTEPVYLLAPKQIHNWLKLYHRKFEKIHDCYNLISNQEVIIGNRKINSDVDRKLKELLGIRNVQTTLVRHCVHAFGVAWTLNNGQKIVYSGDTMPCESLVVLGRNCDLLIHEATMEDSLWKEAVKKTHSTMAQAIEMGEKMNAKFTFLTHFSQRYSKLPLLTENIDYKARNIGIAYDNMQFNFAELPLLPLFYPTLRIMFSDFQEILEARAAKRAKRLKML